MITFREIELSDAQTCKDYFKSSGSISCDYTFGNLYAWKDVFDYKIAFAQDFMFVRLGKENFSYFMPIGNGDIIKAVELLKEQEKGELSIYGASVDDLERLKNAGVETRSATLYRDASDYIYRAEDLINLVGKKYHSKRNFISRFKSSYNWSYEPLCVENIEEAKAFCEYWFEKYSDENGEQEKNVALGALDNFESIGFEGGILRVDGRVIAFTAGEAINDEAYCVHIEKADTEYVGAYNALNQQFLINNCSNYKLINREEDMGIEGLRKAKESYNPAFIFEKYNVII